MCPTSQRGGKTLPGLEKRPGPGLQWIYSPRGMCLACPGSGQRRGRGQERHGPEWRTGRITHQAETVPGQGGVKSPLAGLTLVEGKGLGELMPGPPRWGFTDSLVVGAPGRQGTCGVTEDRRGGRVPPVSGAWSWIWAGGGGGWRWALGGPDTGVCWHQIPGWSSARAVPPARMWPRAPGSAAARERRGPGC